MDLTPVTAEITAYSARCQHCQTTNITADGTNTDLVPYNIAVDRSIKLGTIIYIPPGEGVLDGLFQFTRGFKADDRGGALDREAKREGVLRIDLRVRSCEWARRFGRKRIVVYVAR